MTFIYDTWGYEQVCNLPIQPPAELNSLLSHNSIRNWFFIFNFRSRRTMDFLWRAKCHYLCETKQESWKTEKRAKWVLFALGKPILLHTAGLISSHSNPLQDSGQGLAGGDESFIPSTTMFHFRACSVSLQHCTDNMSSVELLNFSSPTQQRRRRRRKCAARLTTVS